MICYIKKKKSPAVMNRPGRSDFAQAKPLKWNKYLHLVAISKEESYLGLLHPNHIHCNPCMFDYDAVIKMENFDRDSG